MRWRRRTPVATTVEPPRWVTPRSRPRVLIEHHDVDAREPLAHALTAHGYDVLTCAGPRDGAGCPVLHGEPCYALDDAGLVVTGLATTAEGRAIALHARGQRADRPLIVEGTSAMLADADPAVTEHAVYPLVPETVLAELAAMGWHCRIDGPTV
jgi:hypothetical protein